MTLTPHFIPTDQPSRIWKPKTGKEYFLSEKDFPVNESTETFQLLLTSDEPPKTGWTCLDRYGVFTMGNPDLFAKDEARKIIAAYPPIQGIPNITDEDIVYIVANPENNVECAIDMVKCAVTGKKDIQINGGFVQLIRPTGRKIEIEFGTECPHCHETIEGLVPVWDLPPHPERLFTKEDMQKFLRYCIQTEEFENESSISMEIAEHYFNEWLTTHQQKANFERLTSHGQVSDFIERVDAMDKKDNNLK